jgi:hypothetical protein
MTKEKYNRRIMGRKQALVEETEGKRNKGTSEGRRYMLQLGINIFCILRLCFPRHSQN